MKISIIGRGNAGCISAVYFAHRQNFLNTQIEIDLIFDSKIPPVPTGQGTTLEFPQFLFNKFNMGYINELPHTMKTGIMYENFGTKQEKIFHHFPLGKYALHFEPKNFQDFVCKNLNVNFKEIDENISDYNEIDADYIIDCRGSPKQFDNYEMLKSPLNCALLSSLPKKENDVKYTRSIAHKNGWCFYIPLTDKTSLGYVFNKDLTSVEDAEQDFKNTFKVENINRVFPFNQYIAKSPIIDDRVLLNGNKLFFLEPLEATAMGCYIKTLMFYDEYLFNNAPKNEVNFLVKKYVYELQDFILWHYASGSKFNSKFWEYSKKLWEEHDTSNIEKMFKIVKDMSKTDIEKNVYGEATWAQWAEWNFKIWMEGTT